MYSILKLSAFVLAICAFGKVSGNASPASGVSCNNPKASVTSFSTQDATILTELAHIGEFTLKCSNTNTKPLVLYGQFPCGKVVPVAQVGDNKYQVNGLLFLFFYPLFPSHHVNLGFLTDKLD